MFFNFALKFRLENEFFRDRKNYGVDLQSVFFSMQMLIIVMQTAGKKCTEKCHI